MNNEQLKIKFKSVSPDELVDLNLLDKARNGGYICVNCGNGTGSDGTGVEWHLYNNSYNAHCLKCDFTQDIFNLVANKFFGNPDTSKNFRDVFLKTCDIFHEVPDNNPVKNNSVRVSDYRNLIDRWHKCLKEFPYFVNNLYRGIAFDVYNQFYCGWNQADQRFIIPTSYKHFLARYVGDLNLKDTKKHLGSKEIFGAKLAKDFDTVFITEGEFDAMSFKQINLPAISFSGSDISKHQQELLKALNPNANFLICFDNDETGISKSEKIQKILHQLGFRAEIIHLPADYKDPNDFLQADEHAFKAFADSLLHTTFEEIVPEFLVPKDFKVNDEGIFYIAKKDLIKIIDTPVKISRVIHDEHFTTAEFELSWTDRKSGRNVRRIISKRDALDRAKILSLADSNLNINSGKAKYLSQYLTDYADVNCDIIGEIISYAKPGWVGDKFIYPADCDDYLLRNGYDYSDKFTSAGDKKIWLELFNDCTGSPSAMITLGTALAAPIIPFANNRSIQLALIATSGKGKSALAAFAMSAFGNPNNLKNTFNGTANMLNDLSWKFNGLPCWIDEFQTANKALREQLENVIYNFEQGKSRGRLNRDGSDKVVHKFQGSRIFTAEESVLNNTAMQGAYSRLIMIDAQNIIDDDLARRIHKTVADNYGFFGRDWINYISDNKDQISRVYERSFDVLQSHYKNKYMPNHYMTVAAIMTALSLFARNVIHCDEVEELLDYYLEVLFDKYLLSAEDISDFTRAHKFLREVIVTHNSCFKHFNPTYKHDTSAVKYFAEKSSPALGVILEDKEVAFFPNAINKLLRENNYPKAKDVFKHLAEKGLLDTDDDFSHKFQKRKSIDDRMCWMYILKN